MGEKELREMANKFVKENKTKIARQLTDPNIFKPVDRPVSIFMAGSPGAGKTEYSKGLIQTLEASRQSKVVRIDSDEIRNLMPGYTGGNSYIFQGPASLIVERIHDFALDKKQNFIFDGTLSQYDKAIYNIKRSLKRKRLVFIFYIYQEPEIAWQFTQAREKLEGRRIPKEAFIEQFLGARNTVEMVHKEFGQSEVPIILVKRSFSQDIAEIAELDQNLDFLLPNKYTKEVLSKII